MDLKQRIEDLQSVQASLDELKRLNAEVEQFNIKIEEAMKKVKVADGKIVNQHDQVFIDNLQRMRADASKRVSEAAARFNDLKMRTVETLDAEFEAEVGIYRDDGKRASEIEFAETDDFQAMRKRELQRESIRRNGYNDDMSELEMENFDRRQRVAQIEEEKAKNEAELKSLETKLKEAQEKGDIGAIRDLTAEIGQIQGYIKVAEISIQKMSIPYKSTSEYNEEYTAVYNIYNLMERILDEEIPDIVLDESTIQSAIDALHELEEIQEASIPAQTRYDDLKSKMDALKVQKDEAKKAIENIKKGLDNGTITGQYVESSKARLAELEAEVAACEAQEKENTEKMKRLEEEYGLKPKDRDEGDDKGKDEGDDKGKGEGSGKGKGDVSPAVQKLNGLLTRRDEISAAMDAIQAEINKKTEEIGRESDADKSKALSQELSDLQAKYKKLNIEKNKVNMQITDLEKKLDEAEGTKGKSKDDDDGKPKTDAEKKKALEEEYAKLDDEYKRLEAELVKKRGELQSSPDNEALKQEIRELQEEQRKVWINRNDTRGQIGTLEKKIREAEEAARQGGSGKGDDKPVPVKGDAYYDSLSPWGKYKMKKEAFRLTEGIDTGDVSFFRKALLFLPSNKYSAIAGRMLSSGEIKPLSGDIPMLEEAARAEEAARKPEPRDPFDTLTPEQKAKAQEEAAKAAKAQEEAAREGKPQQEQPKREGGER